MTHYQHYKKLDELKSEYKVKYITYNIMFFGSLVLTVSSFFILSSNVMLFIALLAFGIINAFSTFDKYRESIENYKLSKNTFDKFSNTFYQKIYDEMLTGMGEEYETPDERKKRESNERYYRSDNPFRSKSWQWDSDDFFEHYQRAQQDESDMFWKESKESENRERERMNQQKEARKRAREETFTNRPHDDWGHFDWGDNTRKKKTNNRYNNQWDSSWDDTKQKKKTTDTRVSSDPVKNAYTLMGITQKSDINTIKKTYRKLSIKWHPDKWQDAKKEDLDKVNRNMCKLNIAYALIKKDKGIV